MTDKEKQEVYQKFNELAKIQADNMIEAMESLSVKMPEGTEEHKAEVLHHVIQMSTDALVANAKELSKKMNENIANLKPEDLNVGL